MSEKQTRHEQTQQNECPHCGIGEEYASELNSKTNRHCNHCGWNDYGANPNALLKQLGGPPVYGTPMVCGCRDMVTVSHFGLSSKGIPPCQPGDTCSDCNEPYALKNFVEDLS